MKKFLRAIQTVLFALLFLSSGLAYASDPTTSASNVQFPTVDGARFNVSFTPGNGNGGRIVVIKEGSEITGVPADGIRYGYNTAFGTAGTEFTAPGEYVVAFLASSPNNVTVTNLQPGKTYYVAIFELNGNYNTPSTIDYSVVTPTGKMVTTLVAPSSQATITSFTQVAGRSLRVNWTNGNGQGRLVVAAKASSLTATPTDLTTYNFSKDFGSQSNSSYWLSPETFVVFKSTTAYSNYVDVANLEPNTTYTFAIFEYNGSVTPVYLTPATTQTVTTAAGPTQAPSLVSFSKIDGDRLGISWNRGNGTQTLVVIKMGSAVTHVPVNGTAYTANSVFGTSSAEWYGGSGEYVISSGTNNSATITGLEKSTVYYISVFAFDADNAGYQYYNITPITKSQATAMPPTGQTTVTVSDITGSSAKLTYHAPASGGGSSRLLVIRDGDPVDFLPEDLVKYTGSTPNFGTGQLVGTNTYTLYGQSNGGAPTVTGLTPGHTYYAEVFEMNGSEAPVYLRPGSSVQINVPNEPATPSSNLTFPYVDGNSINLDWNAGDGARRIVVVRKDAAVTSVPSDGTTYTAAGKFGDGAELTTGFGEYVVYEGTNSYVSVTGLEKNTTYHFAIFEYNPSASGPDYLTTAGKWLAASHATAITPTVQTSDLTASDIQSGQASISFTAGDGVSRIFVMREGTPVDAVPEDYTKYTYNKGFGTAGSQIGTGNYVVYAGGAGFTVSNLKTGTEYYVTAFEYNGISAPVYLRPGAAVYSFTTTGGDVVAAPVVTATNPGVENVDGNSFTFKWTSGDGANRIVVGRKGSPVSFVPGDGNNYTANAAFATSTDLGDGQYIVFNGSGNGLTLTNLEPSTTYHFAVYEYNGSGASTKYATSALATSASTAVAPTVPGLELSASVASTAITLGWTAGNGDGRIVVAREGDEVSAQPSDLSKYTASTVFGDGPQLAVGQYVVYRGSGSSVSVTGLDANKTYHFTVFEYNGTEAPVYNTTDVLKISASIGSVLPVKWVSFNAAENNGNVVLNWTTAQEINAESYVVERSSDAMHFTPIMAIQAKGGDGQNEYTATDVPNGYSIVYYRIKQRDADGKFSYSSVVQAVLQPTTEVRLLQNPVRNEVGFACTAGWLAGRYEITTASGSVVSAGKVLSTIIRVRLQPGASGVFYLVVFDKHGRRVNLPFVRL